MEKGRRLSYKNLVEVIQDKKETNRGITFITGADNEKFISYHDLYERALDLLFALQHEDLEPGDELVFQVNDNFDFVSIFWACILGKIIPVPVTVGNSDEFRLKLFNIWKILKRPHLVTPGKQLKKLVTFTEEKDLKDIFSDIKEKTFLLEDIEKERGEGEIFIPDESNIAFIQFSSGSTGAPKGVVLTHANLLTNIQAILERFIWPDSEVEADTYLSWMPLTHDMGLICLYLTALTANWHQYLIPPELFIKEPHLWLKKISQHRVTVSASPNFGFNYVLRSFKQEHYKDIDLSSLRLIVNGAEPISVKICREFIHRMTAYGLGKNVILPGYGLAEASVAVSICNPGEKMRIVNIGRESLKIGEKINEVDGGANAVSFVDVGSPVDNCSVRITNGGGQVVGERITGHIQVKGGNVTGGYYNDEEATAKTLTPDGWLDTGDLGFLMNNRLIITGREKDVIFVNGQNYYPHDIERVAEEVEGIELGKIAISNVYNADRQMDEVLCFVVFRRKLKEFVPLVKALKRHIVKEIGVEVHKVIPVKRILKTTSGKLQRYRLKKSYLEGEYDAVIREISNSLSVEEESSKPMKPETGVDIEKIILDICKQVLRRADLGLKDKFVESGCDSLRAAALSSIIHQELEVEIPVSEFFSGLTPAGAAEYVEKEEKTRHSPVEPVEEKEYYPVSSAQKRLYILQEMDRNNCAYNEFFAAYIEKSLDREKLTELFRVLINRHESLRTSFELTGGEPVQRIHQSVDFAVEYYDSSTPLPLISQFIRPFDLSRAPLLRVGLINTKDTENIMMIDMHHIIMDGLSYNTLGKEFIMLSQATPLPGLRLRYRDFSQWQKSREHRELIKQQEKYWLDLFSGELPVLHLPFDYPRPAVQSFEGASVYFILNEKETQDVKDIARQIDATLYMTLLALFNILLSKLSGQEDIIIGIPAAGRRHVGFINIIGMFVNTLALRNYPSADKTFKEFLKEVKEGAFDAYANQDYPFEDLVDNLSVNRDGSRNPVFDVMFAMLNRDITEIEINGTKLIVFDHENKAAKFDLSLEVLEEGDQLRFAFEYCTKLFKKETIEKFTGYFKKLILSAAQCPVRKISELEIISEEEKNRILYEFNDTKADYPGDKTIHGLFEEQAARIPDSIAVIGSSYIAGTGSRFIASGIGTMSITYNELNEKSNQLACLLEEKGAGPDTIMGIMAERSIEMVIGIFGILKAGGAYLPINPGHPQERVEYMLADSGAKILLSEVSEVSKVSREIEVIELTKIQVNEYENYPTRQIFPTQLTQLTHPTQLCYVIYTSGTTGKPKGVMIRHRSVVNRLYFVKDRFRLKESDVVLQQTPFTFDVSVCELFRWILPGASLCLPPRGGQNDPRVIFDTIERHRVTTIDLVPSMLSLFLEHVEVENAVHQLRTLRWVFVGAEVVSPGLAAAFNKMVGGRYKARLINLYGPSEATVDVTCFNCSGIEPAGIVPIGKPMANVRVFILDKTGSLQPVGVPGELCIRGDSLARGYLNHPELTAEKFVTNDQCPMTNDRFYHTGDLARWLPDGNIEFLGRIDHQVKIRGFRIELEEIESQLLTHPQVKEAVVIARGTNEDRSLFAYYVDAVENQPELFPSIGEYPLYDELVYYSITGDDLRNKSYRIAINRLVKDKTVVDIGTGQDAILARFCVEAGAKKVYAIELSEESYKKARETLKKNGLEEKIILIHGDSLNIVLPEKMDVCVSEIIGSIGGSEGAAAILNNARRFLKEDGIIIPGKCITKIAGVRLPQWLQQRPGFSEIAANYAEKLFDYFGYKFDFRLCIRKFPKSNIISNSGIFEALNFSGIIDERNSHEIKLVINRDTTLDGFLLWINLYTIEDEFIDALENEYNWLPVFVPLPFPGIDVSEGDMIAAECIRRRSANNVNPDYKIKGILTRKGGDNIELECDLPYFERGFQRTPYYKKVFDEKATSGIRYINKKIGAGELKEYLKKKLPDYMIPSSFMQIKGIPLTPNGKVDRKALPSPGIKPGEECTAPADELEKKLVEIWSEVLGIDGEAIGINDNFFDLGGNSIKVIRLNSKLKEIFKEDIPVLTMFRSTTVRSLRQYLREEKPPENVPGENWFEAMDRGKNKSNRLKNKMRRPLRNG